MSRVLCLLPALLFLSCANATKKEEQDRQNIFFAEFYYEEGFPARALKHAQKIKPGSPHYADAQEWIALIEGGIDDETYDSY